MLVLSRKIDQDIVIGNDIIVKILEISRNQVKVGVQAPQNVTVHREEVWKAINNEE